MIKPFQKRYVAFAVCAFSFSLVCPMGCTPKAAEKPAESAPKEEAKPEGEKAAETDNSSGTKMVQLDPAGAKTAGIQVRPAALRSTRATLAVSGVVEVANDRIAKVTPPVAGKVVRLLVRLGDPVQSGQPLAVLDSYEVAQARAAVKEAESRIAEAGATLRTAQAEALQTRTRRQSASAARTTQERLARAGAFSEVPLQAARAELNDAQSELLTAQTEQQSQAVVFERNERLFKEGIVSKSELEASQLERQQNATRVSRAMARVESTKQTLAREQRVAQGGLLNRQAVQSAEAEVRAADAESGKATRQVEAAQTALTGARQSREAARTNLRALVGTGQAEGSGGTITVVAPINGVISDQQATLGEAVERTTGLFVVQNLQSVMVEAQIPEAEVARVRVGQRVEVTAASFPKIEFTGTVQSLASGVNEKTRTLAARCLVANPKGLLRPEMFAAVTVAAGAVRRVISVPESAIVAEENKSFVFVATEKNGYEKREVQIGVLADGFREITSGLKKGEPVVTEGTFVLRSESRKGELKEE